MVSSTAPRSSCWATYDTSMDRAPWTNRQLRSLGHAIRDGHDAAAHDPTYDEVVTYFNGLALDAQYALDSLDWEPLLHGRIPEITSRPKTIDTLRQKLHRDRNTPLQNVQDIAGVRFEAEMSLDEQDGVALAIAGLFSQEPASAIHDIRSTPHSGYRAVHIWLKLPSRVEVQVRTHLQGMWANMYESAADTLGREIRYANVPSDPRQRELVAQLQELSGSIADIENERNILDQRDRELA